MQTYPNKPYTNISILSDSGEEITDPNLISKVNAIMVGYDGLTIPLSSSMTSLDGYQINVQSVEPSTFPANTDDLITVTFVTGNMTINFTDANGNRFDDVAPMTVDNKLSGSESISKADLTTHIGTNYTIVTELDDPVMNASNVTENDLMNVVLESRNRYYTNIKVLNQNGDEVTYNPLIVPLSINGKPGDPTPYSKSTTSIGGTDVVITNVTPTELPYDTSTEFTLTLQTGSQVIHFKPAEGVTIDNDIVDYVALSAKASGSETVTLAAAQAYVDNLYPSKYTISGSDPLITATEITNNDTATATVANIMKTSTDTSGEG